MEENQTEDGGISLKDIFRVIFSQKWIALIVLLVVTVAGTAGIYFGSAKDKTYSVSFVLTLPGNDEYSLNYYYPDGTAFRYSDMVSFATLKRVKESDKDFSGVNVETMAKNGDISISREIAETKTNTGSTYESTYNISIKAKYFNSIGFDVARKFMQALAYTPGYYLSQMKIDYGYLAVAENSSDYVSTVVVLKQQLEDLLEQYEALILKYGASFVVDGDKTLQSYMRNVSTYIENNKELDNLITRANLDGLLKSESCIADFKTQEKQVIKDLADAEATLQNMLKAASSDQPSNLTAIQMQSDLVNTLKNKRDYLVNYLANAKFEDGSDKTSQDYTDYTAAKKAYEVDLKAVIASVKGFTDEMQKVTSSIYTKSESVSFTTANIINVVGGKGLVWSLIVSLVAGIVLALIAGYIAGAVKLSKNNKKAKANGEPHIKSLCEAQSEAAVAEKDEK